MSELMELAERCEAAEGADRELDTDILIALFPGARRKTVGEAFIPEKGWEPGSYTRAAPPYTASLDAALRLVPNGFMWRVQGDPDGVSEALAEKNAGDFGAIDARHTRSFASTPALALCAAALRARASS